MKQFYKDSEVKLADGLLLGTVQGLYRRADDDDEEINPDLKLFEYYMEVVNLDIGKDFYIPTAYIDHIEKDGGEVWLSKDFDEVKGETLNREPQFIAHGNGLKVQLLEKS